MDKCLAIIPARGGSKRIPRKNIRPFLGQPIIKYSIDAALESELFDEVMVSTDDHEIAELTEKYGARVPFMRAEETSGDYAGTVEVVEEVLSDYKKWGCSFKYLCCIYPTAPFVTAQKLIEGYRLLIERGADLVMPVACFSSPIQRALKIDDGKLVDMWPEYRKIRFQDLVPTYHDVGQFYWHRVDSLFKRNLMQDYTAVPLKISELEMQDLNYEEDWKLAEMKYRLVCGNYSVENKKKE